MPQFLLLWMLANPASRWTMVNQVSQRAAVRKLAAADGHDGDLIEYDDWGVSVEAGQWLAERSCETMTQEASLH